MKTLAPMIAMIIGIGVIGCVREPVTVPATPVIVDPFSQRSFPCMEDEALMYAPRFGPDRVGCVNVDDLLRDGAR